MERLGKAVRICDREGLYGLAQMLAQTRRFKCTDPRDRVYALLSMISLRDAEINIVPDYSLSVRDVFMDLTIKYFDRFKDANILAYCESRSNFLAMPSWVPDWSEQKSSNITPTQSAAGMSSAHVKYTGNGVLQASMVSCGTITFVHDFELGGLAGSGDPVFEIQRLAHTGQLMRMKTLRLYAPFS